MLEIREKEREGEREMDEIREREREGGKERERERDRGKERGREGGGCLCVLIASRNARAVFRNQSSN